MAQANQGKTERSWSTKQVVWACLGSIAVGGVLTYQAGFNWVGGWETGAEAHEKMAVSACVEQFLLQPDRGVIYAKLKETDSSYQRRKLIQDSKLASVYQIADACDERIRGLSAELFPPA